LGCFPARDYYFITNPAILRQFYERFRAFPTNYSVGHGLGFYAVEARSEGRKRQMSPKTPSNSPAWLDLAQHVEFRVPRMAKKLGISERQLERTIHLLFGRSPQAWMSEQGLLIAADLLKRRRSVKIVASELGFRQISHFSREFKRYYGLSPTAFLTRSDREGLPAADNAPKAARRKRTEP
jgi:AraC-like DNA-binding protein